MKKCLRLVIVFTLAGCLLLLNCSCSEIAVNNSGPTPIYKVGILTPDVEHGWVAAVTYHAEKYGKELNNQIDYKLCKSKNVEEMRAQLDELMAWECDAIIAFPQWKGLEEPLQSVINQGVIVVNCDIQMEIDGLYCVSGDDNGMGVQGAQYIVDKIGKKGNVVILKVPTAGSVSEVREKGFVGEMTKIAPDMKLITYATKFTREDAQKDFKAILGSKMKIDAVYSMDDETSIGVVQAIKEAGRADIKVVTGGGGCQEYFHMMPENKDIWIQSALYSPEMVKDAVDIALSILKGENVNPITVIPTTIVDRENYKEYLDKNSPY